MSDAAPSKPFFLPFCSWLPLLCVRVIENKAFLQKSLFLCVRVQAKRERRHGRKEVGRGREAPGRGVCPHKEWGKVEGIQRPGENATRTNKNRRVSHTCIYLANVFDLCVWRLCGGLVVNTRGRPGEGTQRFTVDEMSLVVVCLHLPEKQARLARALEWKGKRRGKNTPASTWTFLRVLYGGIGLPEKGHECGAIKKRIFIKVD